MIMTIVLYTTTGMIVGAAAGIAPGPLMALLVSNTLRHGTREGIQVAVAPLLTDLPIIGVSLIVMTHLPDTHWPFGLISLFGSGYLCYLAWESITMLPPQFNTSDRNTGALTKGVVVNLLNPHPYLFWLTVGAPLLIKLWATAPLASAGWASGFYVTLVGTKIVIALIVGQSKRWLKDTSYVGLNRILGILMGIFALIIARDGLRLLNLIE